MSLFKCKMCGGALEVSSGETVAVCEYCGTKQTLPKLDDERKANLYDRANHFRRGNDFDKAAAIYEQILDADTEDAEAYWSLVLCRYGIEYVEDPASHKRLPTVNRAQFTSIFADEDYKSAIKYADGYQREIYEQEAKAIDEIQRGILAISEKEEPFDVFICYKETDANGRRTPDSVLANELYHELTKEGFKVFFSRITLEDKLGTAYEPYIFAALNSAKVMVVVGTKAEYFNAVWVKNEWSRYLALIKNGAKKTLIPAYRDMDPYDLPDEFSHLQAQDMSKLGFMQDLIRGIKKIVQAGEPKATVVKETVVSAGSANVAPLLRRAFMFLEDKDWKSANDYCEKVLDLEPENAEAYLGKLLAQLRVDREENLKNSEFTFDQIGNYEKIMRFGSEELKARLEGYNRFIIERNKAEELEEKYSEAVAAMKKAYKKPDYIAVSEMFKEISDYKDSAELYEKCLAEAEVAEKRDIYLTALELMNRGQKSNNVDKLEEAIGCFENVKGYESADEYIIQCRKSIETIKNNLKKRALAEMREREAAHRKNIITTVLAIIFLVVVVFLVVLFTVILPKIRYNKAVEAYLTGSYSEAMEATNVISRSGYSDAPIEALRQTVQVYFDAVSLYESNNYSAAYGKFLQVQNYRDSVSNYLEPAYKKAIELKNSKDYESALKIFEGLGNYKDSVNNAAPLRYLVFENNRYIQIAATDNHIVGLMNDGTVSANGSNSDGQCDVSTWTDIVSISAGPGYTIGLKSDGTVVATGSNTYGECDVSEWSDIVAISTSGSHTVGLKSDGTVVATGSNKLWQCNVSEWADITAVSANVGYTIGLKADGTVVFAGTTQRINSSVSEWTDIISIFAGYNYALGLKNDGTVISNRSSNRTLEWTNIIAISGGKYHTVGLKSDGTVVAEGINIYGECDVSNWRDIIAIFAGSQYTVGLKSDGTIVTAGKKADWQYDTAEYTE